MPEFPDEMLERARAHKRDCGLEGHCTESGYGLVDAEGRIALLDPKATPLVLNALHCNDQDHGIKLRVKREMQADGEMKTTKVEEV